MIRPDAQNAEPLASNLAITVTVAVAAVFATANHVRCILPPVQVVGTKHKFLSNHATTGQYIVAIASNLRVPPIEAVVVSRAGSAHE
jgi:hypothetical protein